MNQKKGPFLLTLLLLIVCINNLHAYTPLSERKVIFMDEMRKRICDPGSQFSSPKPEFHSKTDQVRYLRAKEWNVIKQRMAAIPNFSSHEEAARFFLSNDSYGPLFGLKDEKSELKFVDRITIDSGSNATFIGRTFVRFKQLYNDVEVFGGEIIVQLNARNELLAIIGEILPDIDISTDPSVSSSSARQTALNYLASFYNTGISQMKSSDPELVIYNTKITGGSASPSSALVWRVHISSDSIDEFVLVEARFANIVSTHFSIEDDRLFKYSQSGSIASALKRIQIDITNPETNQPDRVGSPFYECNNFDNFAVESNSNIIMKAAYLMAHGGNFNGKSITAIGVEETKDIFNEAKLLLTSACDYAMLFDVLLQACKNLGYSSFVFEQIKKALEATEMNTQICSEEIPGQQHGHTNIPACDSGVSINNLFFDGLENGGGNWVSGTMNNHGNNFWFAPQALSTIGMNESCAANGNGNIWSYAQADVSDSFIAMKIDIKLPPNSYLHFNHAFQFEKSNNNANHFNGGIVEYSINGGLSWTDAGSLFIENQYNGLISSTSSPLNGKRAFVSSSQGYISSKLDLNALRDKNIRFRFRMATSDTTAHYGWFIDDIRIYTCDLFASIPSICENSTIQSSSSGNWNSPATWSPYRVPSSSDIVHIRPGQIVTVNSGSKIIVKSLFNEGAITSEKNYDINISATDFIFNRGKIWASDGNDGVRYSTGTNGSNVTIDSYAILNDETGDIQAGRGGNHISYLFFKNRNVNSRGGNGGNIFASCSYIVNNGNIGPAFSSRWISRPEYLPGADVDGGNGGAADNWDNYYNHNTGIPYGGGGGYTYVTGFEKAVNNGSVGSGRGGYAHYSDYYKKGVPGTGGKVFFWSPDLQSGPGSSVHAGGNGSLIWDPEIFISGSGTKFYGAQNIMIFGGKGWELNLQNLDPHAISAKSIIIGIGEEGVLNFQDASEDIFESENPIYIYADNFSDGSEVLDRRRCADSIARTFDAPKTIVFQSEELFEFDISADPQTVSGKVNDSVSTKIYLINNGPRPDYYALSYKDKENLVRTDIPETIRVAPGIKKEILVEIQLPDFSGNQHFIYISAQSITSPDKIKTSTLSVIVQPEIAAVDIVSNESSPLQIECIPHKISNDTSITSYAWDFGDNATSSEQNPTHEYQKGGTYPVTLTLTDSSGNTEIIRKRIAVQSRKILLLAADYINVAKTALLSTGLFQSEEIDIMERPSSISLSDLTPYNAVLVWSSYAFSDPENIGNVLKDYVDNGGGLVIASYSYAQDDLIVNVGLKGGILDAEYSPFLPGESANMSGNIDLESITDPDHYIFNGINEEPTFWVEGYESNPELNTGAKILAIDSDGNNMIATNAKGNIIGIAIYPERLSQANSSAKRLLGNAILFVSSEPSELNADATVKNVIASPGKLSFEILNTGKGVLHWFAETQDHWLSIEEGFSGTDRGIITVRYDAHHDAASSRTGIVRVSGVGALNSPLELKIIQSANQSPVIDDIPDQATLEDTRIEIPVSITDIDNSALILNVSARAVNTELVSDNGFSFSNPGADRILIIDPMPNRFGTTDIIISVNDGINSTSTSFTLNITPVNDAPSFIHRGNIVLQENAGPQTFSDWAFNIDEGQFENQALDFTVHVMDESFFSVLPDISPEGTLTFTANGNGETTVTVFLSDNGGIENGGINKSNVQSFNVRYEYIPHFKPGKNLKVLEDSGKSVITNWATNITPGPYGNAEDISFVTSNYAPELFSIQPYITKEGTLIFQPAPDANGFAVVRAYMTDGGETNNKSVSKRFYIRIDSVNDRPFFTGSNHESLEDAGPQFVKNWATNINPGPINERLQSTRFYVDSIDNPALFSSLPDILPDGTLTYTSKKDANGTAVIKVYLKDDGGIDNDGANDSSTVKAFTISVKPVNDIPSFTKGQDVGVLEDALPQEIGWAFNMNAGPPDEKASQSLSFIVTTDNEDLFSSQPFVSSQGRLMFSVRSCKNGTARVCVRIKDDGGIQDGGIDESAPQCIIIAVKALNDKPTFDLSQDVHYFSDHEVQKQPFFVSNISGGECEPEQNVYFDVSTSNDSLFDQLPDISKDGLLTYKPSALFSTNASATISVQATDDADLQGQYQSDVKEFTISYETLIQYSLNLSIEGGCGKVKINGVPHTDSNWIKKFDPDAPVTLEAVLDQNSNCQFEYWAGDITDTLNPLPQFLMDSSKSVIAKFGYDSDSVNYTFYLKSGWNMISFPLIIEENSISSVFSNLNVAYKYENGAYVLTDTIEYGRGFWVKIPEDNSYSICGEPYKGFTNPLSSGWHLSGCPYEIVAPNCDNPEAILAMFKYINGSYQVTESCEPGYAFWIKIAENPCPNTCNCSVETDGE